MTSKANQNIAANDHNDINVNKNQKVKTFMDLLEPISRSYRIDKNMAFNIEDFSENVARSLVIYFSFSYQSNFFGFGTFDPEDFGRVMGYDLSYLQRKHPNPLQLKGLSKEEVAALEEDERMNPQNRLFDSILENALYFLTEPIRFRKGGKVAYWQDGNRYYSEIGSFQYLKSVSCQFTRGKGGKGKDKILYNYTVSDDFLSNMNNFYLSGSIQSHVALRKNGLDDLYFYLKNVQNSMQARLENEKLLKFDELVSLANISQNYNKADKKKYLKKALKTINDKSELKFDFDFVAGGSSRWKYVPKITFHNSFITQADLAKYQETQKRVILSQCLIHEFRSMFQQLQPSKFHHAKRVDNFLAWLVSDAHQKEKQLAYDNAYLKTYGSLNRYHEEGRRTFFFSLKGKASLHEIFHYTHESIDKEVREVYYY